MFSDQITYAAGFHTKNDILWDHANKPLLYDNFIKHDITVVLSWIPILSIISGIYNLHLANQLEKAGNESKCIDLTGYAAYAKSYKARAIASFCQASVFLMIFDIFATIGRFASCCQPNEDF